MGLVSIYRDREKYILILMNWKESITRRMIYMMNIGALIIGIGFFIIAILDGIGSQIHINKRYRISNRVRVKEWQKKRVLADILICVGAIIIYLSPQNFKVQFYIGALILSIGIIFLYIFDNKFKKNT